MENEYKGIIVEESLSDNRIINDLKIINVKISHDEKPEDRWHLYTVLVDNEDIENLSKNIKSDKWYMHFWDDNKNIIAIFKDKKFEFNYDDKFSWTPAIEYGISIGIPKEQLDFIIN